MRQSGDGGLLAFGFATFLVFGACLVLLGASQAELARDLGLDFAATGLLGACFAFGIGAGSLGSGPLIDRFERRPLFCAITLLAAVSLCGWHASMSLHLAGALVALLGACIGAQETVINACVGEHHGASAARPMLIVHSAATLGAMLAPLALEATTRSGGWTLGFRLVGALHLALAAGVWCVALPRPLAADRNFLAGLLDTLRPALLPFALLGFAYVGSESALTLFAVPYVRDVLDLPEARGRTAISAFWAGLLIGRLLVLARRPDGGAELLVRGGLAGAVLVACGIGGALPAPELVFGLFGVSIGFVFPLLLALTGARFAQAQGAAMGAVAAAGALGGVAIPALHGALAESAGVRASLSALLGWCLVFAAAASSLLRGKRN